MIKYGSAVIGDFKILNSDKDTKAVRASNTFSSLDNTNTAKVTEDT